MTDQIILGTKPAALRVVLTAHSSWVVSGTVSRITWEAGDQLVLVFNTGTQWGAELDADKVLFDLSAVQVDALLAQGPRSVSLVHVSPEGERTRWASGDVEVVR